MPYPASPLQSVLKSRNLIYTSDLLHLLAHAVPHRCTSLMFLLSARIDVTTAFIAIDLYFPGMYYRTRLRLNLTLRYDRTQSDILRPSMVCPPV